MKHTGNRLQSAGPHIITRLVLAVGVLAALSSCVSPEELRRQDEAACTSYGFHAGTEAFAACLQKESLARRYRLASPGFPYAACWSGPLWGPCWP